jgi:hypothetical protein
LEAIVRENVRSREQELVRCREIITERAAALLDRFAPNPGRARKYAPEAEAQWAFTGVPA